jgi:mRNA interferase MazF
VRSPAFKPGDVVVVPFPFSTPRAKKRRPALVCSRQEFNGAAGHVVLAMITTATAGSWPSDVRILDLASAGLPPGSVVRWKLFTLPVGTVIRKIGALSAPDRSACGLEQPVRIGATA